jgi:hypothetical protein
METTTRKTEPAAWKENDTECRESIFLTTTNHQPVVKVRSSQSVQSILLITRSIYLYAVGEPRTQQRLPRANQTIYFQPIFFHQQRRCEGILYHCRLEKGPQTHNKREANGQPDRGIDSNGCTARKVVITIAINTAVVVRRGAGGR